MSYYFEISDGDELIAINLSEIAYMRVSKVSRNVEALTVGFKSGSERRIDDNPRGNYAKIMAKLKNLNGKS